ncbi:MAG: hypothetical protein SCJ93_08445 [Bacillota bacterium]|nr:hypothetical protein [Bacillota bacterium]
MIGEKEQIILDLIQYGRNTMSDFVDVLEADAPDVDFLAKKLEKKGLILR